MIKEEFEELIQFLKDNLRIEVLLEEDEGYLETTVNLYLGDDMITSSSDSANIRTVGMRERCSW